MARRKVKKGGRPKGLKQSAAAKKKIRAALLAYWNSPAGKKRKKAMSRKGKAGTKKKVTSGKATWSAPKATARKRKPGRPKGSKNKTTAAKPAVKKRRAPMAA